MTRTYDPLQYVRDYYSVPAYKGVKVTAYGKSGVITGADGPHICIRLDGERHSRPYHPTDGITYNIEIPEVPKAI
jgi:hypothetical protein